MTDDIMHGLKRTARQKVMNNLDRVNKVDHWFADKNEKKYMVERFRAITTTAQYIPTTNATKFFRINDMSLIEKIRYSRNFWDNTIYGQTFNRRIEYTSTYLGAVWDKLDLKSCKSLIYKPGTFVSIRKSIVDLLDCVGCSYWDYYEDYLIPRNYSFTTPLMELSILCYDMVDTFCPCAATVTKYSHYSGNGDRVYRLESLQTYLEGTAKLILALDEYMDKPIYKDFMKTDISVPNIHEYARQTRDVELLYELDRLYASVVIMDIAQVCLTNRTDPKRSYENHLVADCPLDRHTPFPDLDNSNRNVKELLKEVGFICADALHSIQKHVKYATGGANS